MKENTSDHIKGQRLGFISSRCFCRRWIFFSSPEPKARVSYCHSASSVHLPSVRLSIRPSGVNFSHFQLLLQNRLIDFDETWYGWSTQGPLQVLWFFGQFRPGMDQGWCQNRSRGSPSQGCKLPLAHSPMRPNVVCGLPEIKNWSPTWRPETRGE